MKKMLYCVEISQNNGLWEEIEIFSDLGLASESFFYWKRELPYKNIQLVKKQILAKFDPNKDNGRY